MVRMLTVFHSADPQAQVKELEWQRRFLRSDLEPRSDTPEQKAAKAAAVKG